MADRVGRELVVHGRVQGVFFRAFVADSARRHGVAGSAVNEPDGTVRVRLEGEPAAVTAVAADCQTGPERAVVERVEAADVPVAGLTRFETG
ncbi:MAG: acylphosphatase [Solirubrobacterales bacterium]